MSTVTTVPGVYIEEDASPAISVSQGATAVPLFIARFHPLNDEDLGKIIRISSWLDFSQKFLTTRSMTAKVAIESKVDDTTDSGYAYTAGVPQIAENSAALSLQL
jgi:hypothetical protein